jgi:hypothetical protein
LNNGEISKVFCEGHRPIQQTAKITAHTIRAPITYAVSVSKDFSKELICLSVRKEIAGPRRAGRRAQTGPPLIARLRREPSHHYRAPAPEQCMAFAPTDAGLVLVALPG